MTSSAEITPATSLPNVSVQHEQPEVIVVPHTLNEETEFSLVAAQNPENQVGSPYVVNKL